MRDLLLRLNERRIDFRATNSEARHFLLAQQKWCLARLMHERLPRNEVGESKKT